MPSKTENSELIEAINRNTAATRSIAIFIVGFLPWFIVGVVMIAIGGSLASRGDTVGAVIGIIGIAVLLFGIVQTISRSLSELKQSQLPKDKA
jgi:mannose/fructose/N-acetylgalactosamine-specific phosphotransferase system component IID